jgi:zinc/manganese transport system permease protein
MTSLYELILAPFVDYAFMRRALVASIALACSSAPLGVLLILRRLSLMAEAMSHAIMPGIALMFVFVGFSLPLLSLGGLGAGIVVAVLAGLITRCTTLREDASFAALYSIGLALGVLLVSLKGSTLDLLHVLFGSLLAVDDAGLWVIVGIAGGTLLTLALLYRPLIMAASDPVFFQSQGGHVTRYHLLYLVLVTLNLVAGFQALGTLMTVGMMIVPAVATRFWVRYLDAMLGLAALLGLAAGWIGLLLSYHFSIASGPAIILVAGGFYAFSLLFGRYGSLRARYWPSRHLTH